MSFSKIAVVGCGRMGRGIAHLAAQHGLDVTAVPGRSGGRERALAAFEKDRERLARRDPKAAEASKRVVVVERVQDVANCDLWIESIIEDLESKQTLLKAIEAHAAPGAIIATNTSSLPLGELAKSLNHPERFVALHFFNPPARMKLVEVGVTTECSAGAVKTAFAFCEAIERRPIQVSATSGYVVNRLLVPQLLHAMQVFQSGVASIVDIDEAMQLGLSHAMGPLALADYIGLDVVMAMANTMRRELDDARFEAPTILRSLVEAKHLGRKSGLGFYDYRGDERVANVGLKSDS